MTTKAGGFAFSDDLIIINYENAISNGYTIDTIITHESSHILFKQNMKSCYQKLWDFSYKNLWFSEGLAVYNQGYITYSLLELKKELLDSKLVYEKSRNNFYTKPNNKRSDYSIYYYFLEYIIEKYGEERLHQYVKLMVDQFNNAEKNYYKVFNTSFYDDLRDFSKNILDSNLE